MPDWLFHLEIAEKIATVTMDGPPINAMTEAWVAGFHTLLDTLELRQDWAVLHLRSALPVFSTGTDLAEMHDRLLTHGGLDAQMYLIRGYQKLFDRIGALPRVTLAEIGGAALGGGLELALACDLRIASHDATLGLPELRLGLTPGGGATQRLSWLCGRTTASRLILGAEVLEGATAERLGVVQWSVPHSELPDQAGIITRRFAAMPGPATAAAKRCIAAAADQKVDGFATEIEELRGLLQTGPSRALLAALLAGA
jgi:enoyl-CoA hydratase